MGFHEFLSGLAYFVAGLAWAWINWHYLQQRRSKATQSKLDKVISFYNVGAIIVGLLYAAFEVPRLLGL